MAIVGTMSKCPRKAKPKTGPYQNSSEVGAFWGGGQRAKKHLREQK